MASPFPVDATLITGGMDFQPSNRIAILGDASLLTAATTASNVTTLNRITNPSSTTPTVTAVTTFTYGGGTSTALVADLLVNQNGSSAGVDDIWLVLASDASAGSTIEVVHGTFTQSGATFSWDTKTSTGVTLGSANSQVASIAWNGTNLIVAYRDGASPWVVKVTWTATKNGTAGWQASFVLNTAANSGSHANPMLRHDANLAGGSAGATICLYTHDILSTHSDQFAARVLLDSAASAASTNWKAEVLGGPTVQNIGAALQSACVDPANGSVHLTYNSSTAGTGGAIGTSYIPITVSSLGVPSFGTRQLIDTTSGTSPAICVDALGRVYVFYSSAALNSNSIIDYKTADSPYTTFSGVNTTVFSTAASGDNAPHVPSHDQAVSGYVPLFVQRGKTSWSSQFDNTISAQTSGSTLNVTATCAGVGSTSATLTEAASIASTAAGVGSTTATVTETGTALNSMAAGVGSTTATLTEAATLTVAAAGVGSTSATITSVTAGIGIVVTTQTQSGITGGPPGNGTTETDASWTNASGNGWRVGMIPAYGGALISPWYEIDTSSPSITETSLATSSPDGFIHLLSNVGGVFTGTENPTYTLAEIAPTGQNFRRYYDSGTVSPSTGPALNYRVRTVIQPGDPGFLFHRIDITNPSASAVTLAGADGMEIAMIGGLSTVNQGGANAWPGTSGLYATVGGAETAWPGDTSPGPAAANPDYVYISPAAGSGLTLTPFSVRKTGLIEASIGTTAKISYLGPPDAASSRVKVKVQVTVSSFPGSTTKTLYYLQGLRRSVAAGEINAIAADYLNPDAAGAWSVGTGAAYSYDEGCNVAAAASNVATITHTFPTNVTVRWLPAYKITGWTSATAPVPTLGGSALVANTDYITYVDTGNQIGYVKLMFSLVASGATTGQKNNAALSFTTGATTLSLTSTAAGVGSTSATLTETATIAATGVGVGSSTAVLTEAASLTVTAIGAGSSSATLTQVGVLTCTAAGVGGTTANISSAAGGAISSVAGGTGSASATLTQAALLASTAGGIGGAVGVVVALAALLSVAGGVGGTLASVTLSGGGGFGTVGEPTFITLQPGRSSISGFSGVDSASSAGRSTAT